MRVEKIENLTLRRVAIVGVLAFWAVTFAGYAVGMVIEEAYWGARLAVGALRKEYANQIRYFKRNLGKIW